MWACRNGLVKSELTIWEKVYPNTSLCRPLADLLPSNISTYPTVLPLKSAGSYSHLYLIHQQQNTATVQFSVIESCQSTMPCRPAVCSHSLGRAWVHELEPKLDQAARHGLDIELFYEDLEYLANSLSGPSFNDRLREAAKLVRSMCNDRQLSIVCLQPFMHYEGLRDRIRHQERIEEMKLWLELVKILDTDIIAIPSTCLPESEVSGDIDLIVQDMREVADLAAPENVRIAYESLAWGTYADTWEDAWNVVRRTDRSNFGICLDTFNMAARVYADPSAPSRRNPGADEAMQASLDRLVKTVDVKKIFFVQVVDAEYLSDGPLVEGHRFYDESQAARMSWSRNCRLFYGERDAYLPIKAILKAILVDLGFQGWVSAELFNRSLTGSNPDVPEAHAQRAAVSWRKIVDDFKLAGPTAQRPAATSLESYPGLSTRAQL